MSQDHQDVPGAGQPDVPVAGPPGTTSASMGASTGAFMGAPVGTPSRRKGPGLLEALVALSILVSLSGVVMPLLSGEDQAQRMVSAQRDMQAIAQGLMHYKRDTLYLPTGARGRTDLAWLYGPGAIPARNEFAERGSARELADALLNPSLGGPGWQGPYLETQDLGPDPWGQAYIVHVDGWISGRQNPFVICAGPNGSLETLPSDRHAAGDDLLYMLD